MAEEQLLANQNDYLEAGIHIATKVKSPGMTRFIYKVRDDGLYLLDLKTIDTRILTASKMIARYQAEEVVVTASRIYAIVAAQKFAEIISAKFIKGRVTPGIFTNPNRPDFMEPKLIVISDSRNEKQAIREASKINMPIVALSDTDNSTKFIDMIIPSNNRGRRSLAFIYFLMAREVLKARGAIATNEEFKYTVADFEAKVDTTRPQQSSKQEGMTARQRY
ncbi:MAG TPA: 30S ribosomal protein S2 [Candidatus Baltobacteraceae bacterium]|nr:30S ribosomal protein S2 [Candidatus Baltobacteraceae bacterium]